MAQRKSPPKEKRRSRKAGRAEDLHPEKAAAVIEAIAHDPDLSIKHLAEVCGLPSTTTEQLINRLHTDYQPVVEGLRQVSTSSIIAKLEHVTDLVLESLDWNDIKGAPVKDRAILMGIAIEKRQLLRGEPTQILTFEERKKLDELLPAVLREAKRRGMTLDLTPDSVEVADGTPQPRLMPPDETHTAALSKTEANMNRAMRRRNPGNYDAEHK